MPNTCPICGAETFPGARFCRRCGAVLTAAGAGEQVSPRASTIPLKEDAARATEGLAPEDAARASADTSRVSRAELERLLREHDTGERAGADGRQDGARTRPGTDYDPDATIVTPDEELTVTVPRHVTPFDTHETSAGLGATRETGAVGGGPTEVFDDSFAAASTDAHAAPAPTTPPAPKKKTWPVVVAVCASVLVLVTVAALVAVRFWRSQSPTDAASQAPVLFPPAPDAKQVFEEKLAEAESLLAQGNMEGALARLREANAVDPSNTRGRRRLAELLVAAGSRREAIEELKAVARLAPEDFTAWRQLAAAQYAEGLHRDAAESYRRLVSLVGESAADPNDLLSYADALRLSGRVDEARSTYQRLASNASADVAGSARQRLAELTQPAPTPAEGSRPGEAQPGQPQPPGQGETASASQPATPSAPQAAPTPAPQSLPPQPPQPPSDSTPNARYRRGVELWSSNRAAALSEFQAAAGAGLPDAHYYLGLNYVEGKNINGLKRAEVVAALQHFQLAQRGGRNADQARRYAQQLEKEFDRLRRQ
ncbi:MAG TPA: tetratricopeptide repeat protein [Pyrinomonadaceae bacterium]|jgi:tetratricopeptide (TPR) repeat protein|nr:tetratricopeptide repeat protein [Pyrinomonadaceae bacterium]